MRLRRQLYDFGYYPQRLRIDYPTWIVYRNEYSTYIRTIAYEVTWYPYFYGLIL